MGLRVAGGRASGVVAWRGGVCGEVGWGVGVICWVFGVLPASEPRWLNNLLRADLHRRPGRW